MAADDTMGDVHDAELSDGLRDRLIGQLSAAGVRVAAVSSPGLRLVAESSRARARADVVVETSVHTAGDTLRLRLRVIDAAQGVFLLSRQWREPTAALDRVADEAAAAVAAALATEMILPAHAAADSDIEEARMLCAKGQYFCAKRDETALRRAIACFEQARALAPTYAPAYTGLASAYAILGFYDLLPPREAFPLAKQAALTARALDPTNPECHASLGYIAKYFDWHWGSAERELENAIHLDPQLALGHQWLGNYLVLRGRSDDAIAAMRRAVKLAPESAIATAATGWAYYFAGDHHQAIDLFLEGSELDPQLSMAHAWRGQTLEQMGRYDEAVAALRTAASLMPTSGAFEALLAHAVARSGSHDEARDMLRRLMQRRRTEYVPSYELAKVHLALGDSTKAMHWLETAFRERSHSMGFLLVDPQLAPLRDRPRLLRLARQAGHS